MKRSPSSRLVVSMMILLPILWALAWYLALLIREDCLDAWRKVSGLDDNLAASFLPQCERAEARLFLVSTLGLAVLFVGEALGWWMLRSARTGRQP